MGYTIYGPFFGRFTRKKGPDKEYEPTPKRTPPCGHVSTRVGKPQNLQRFGFLGYCSSCQTSLALQMVSIPQSSYLQGDNMVYNNRHHAKGAHTPFSREWLPHLSAKLRFPQSMTRLRRSGPILLKKALSIGKSKLRRYPQQHHKGNPPLKRGFDCWTPSHRLQ